MATWSSVHANFPDARQGNGAVTDGVNIYGAHDNITYYEIWKYEPLNGDAKTVIADQTNPAVGQDTIYGSPRNYLTWFKGHLYNIKSEAYPDQNTSIRFDVYRWTGGTSWQIVESIDYLTIAADSDYSPPTARLRLDRVRFYTKDYLIICIEVIEFGGGLAQTTYTRYTGDGVSWYTAIVDNSVMTEHAANYADQTDIFLEIGIVGSGVDSIYKFNGSGWVETLNDLSGNQLVIVDGQYVWKKATNHEYSTDGATFNSVTDGTIKPLSTNANSSIGAKVSGFQLQLKLWDTGAGDWDSGTEVIINGLATPSAYDFLRLDNGDCFIHIFDGSGEQWMTRSDPLGGPGQPDEEDPYAKGFFYYGKGKLIRRSDPPIRATNLGGIHLVGHRVFVGTKSTVDSEIVAYSESPPYESWTDYSGSLASSEVKSFSATPWADSEDLDGSEDPEDGFQGGPGGQCS